MMSNECLSDICPDCGAQMNSQVTYTPVRGKIQSYRTYSCGRKVRIVFEVVDIHVREDCGASKKMPRL